MKPARAVALSVLAGVLVAAPLLLAQEQPLVAGADGVPVPKRTKIVKPVYPAEALAQGLRGIVILDLVVDPQGRVVATSVVRSVPGLDEAAIAAARQWEYEPTKVDGKPVSVRLTVPITFTLALPTIARDSGIPELRQGIAPAAQAETGNATAEVTLEGDGRVGTARVTEGREPFAGALLAALQTWRFSPPPEDTSISFRVEAQFSPARGSDPAHVVLKASGLQRSDVLTPPASSSTAAPASAPTAAADAAVPAPTTAPPPGGNDKGTGTGADTATGTKTAQGAPPPQAPPPGAPAAPGSVPDARPPQPASPAAPAPAGTTPAPPTVQSPPVTALPAPPARPTPAGPATPADRSAPPPVEVITAPAPQQPPENGISAIRDVTLEPGVPDLTRGRRPVSPPLARMAGATGAVDVSFSVSAAGTTLVQNVSGPDLLKKAAEQTVASWVFRRTRADRAYLSATFSYGTDKTGAVVRPQAAPASGGSASGGPGSAPGSAGAVAAPASRPAEGAVPAQRPPKS